MDGWMEQLTHVVRDDVEKTCVRVCNFHSMMITNDGSVILRSTTLRKIHQSLWWCDDRCNSVERDSFSIRLFCHLPILLTNLQVWKFPNHIFCSNSTKIRQQIADLLFFVHLLLFLIRCLVNPPTKRYCTIKYHPPVIALRTLQRLDRATYGEYAQMYTSLMSFWLTIIISSRQIRQWDWNLHTATICLQSYWGSSPFKIIFLSLCQGKENACITYMYSRHPHH